MPRTSGHERRLNLIVFLNPEWEASFGGALQLYEAVPTSEPTGSAPGSVAGAGGARPPDGSAGWRPGACMARVLPAFNRAVLFDTAAPSFHGLPEPIACPAGTARRSIALYYLTPPRAAASARSKALYVAAPGAAHDDELERLRQLRSQRRWRLPPRGASPPVAPHCAPPCPTAPHCTSPLPHSAAALAPHMPPELLPPTHPAVATCCRLRPDDLSTQTRPRSPTPPAMANATGDGANPAACG